MLRSRFSQSMDQRNHEVIDKMCGKIKDNLAKRQIFYKKIYSHFSDFVKLEK